MCAWPYGISNVLAVLDESPRDHECEEDVERQADRKVWWLQARNLDLPGNVLCARGLVIGHHDAQCYVSNVSRGCRSQARVRTQRSEVH